jgi:phosphate starvation-inducible PhoH-like protein
MRGRTLNDSFVIMDEAQNTTSEQMKMFVTRLGFNSKAVITGDITQIDLPNARRSGLVEAIDILKPVQGLAFVYFDESDVVRHHLVQRIIRAYDDHKTRLAEQQMSLSLEGKAAEVRSADPGIGEVGPDPGTGNSRNRATGRMPAGLTPPPDKTLAPVPENRADEQ